MDDGRVIEQRWVEVGGRVMDHRLDALRGRADFLAHMIHIGKTKDLNRDKREHAALMWAIAELSGIGDEVRRERQDREHVTAGMVKKERKRAEAAEALNIQYRVKVAALKHELYLMRGGDAAQAFDPDVTKGAVASE